MPKGKSALIRISGSDDVFMRSVCLNPEKAGICAQKNGYRVFSGRNLKEILRFHHEAVIDRIHMWNQAHFPGGRYGQFRAAEGTGSQLADPTSVHVNIKDPEKRLFLPFFPGDPNLALQLQRKGVRFRSGNRRRAQEEKTKYKAE